MVEYETINTKEIKFGKNNFIEISRKKAITDDGENEFLSIARGWYGIDGQKKWKGQVTLPADEEKREEIGELIKSL